MKRAKRCRTCGLPIDFVLRGGFVPKGQPRFFIVNADDRTPHRPRCNLTVALKKAKTHGPAQMRRLKKKQAQAETAEQPGEQIDAFSDQ